jgi:hypothetical protein
VRRSARLIALCIAAVAALAVAGCGNRQEVRTQAGTEGPYIDVGDLKYQIQISRILNPSDVEDTAYLRGISEGVAPSKDEVWFGIFMRVENTTKQTRTPADQFEITDTQDQKFTPLNLDANVNVFAYKPTPIPGGALIPKTGSAAADNTIQGSLVLFKVKTASLYNRPLELHISSSEGGTTGIVDIDV